MDTDTIQLLELQVQTFKTQKCKNTHLDYDHMLVVCISRYTRTHSTSTCHLTHATSISGSFVLSLSQSYDYDCNNKMTNSAQKTKLSESGGSVFHCSHIK